LVDLNVKCVQLEVSSLNLIAQRFYKKIGFIRVGMRKKYYSEFEDALLYNLEIK
jgi:ribosomal protein S18 acetylase RimI-like enzyme